MNPINSLQNLEAADQLASKQHTSTSSKQVSHSRPYPTPRRLVAVLMLGLIVTISGCFGYGSVSQKTFDLAMAIEAVCNRQQPDKLPLAHQMVDESLQKQEINEKEAGWLKDILKLAEQGKWEQASVNAKRLLADQTR